MSDFVLASTSPRRHQLLREAGYRFAAVDPGDDGPSTASDPAQRVLDHARHKARAGARQCPMQIVLASDTLVWCAGEFLPKPSDRDDALRMLRLLEDRSHEVWTGVCVVDRNGQLHEEACGAEVRFARWPETELRAYLDGDEWRDKAGAYAIQGTAGSWCSLIAGTFDTVVGLPLDAVRRQLNRAGACPPAPSE